MWNTNNYYSTHYIQSTYIQAWRWARTSPCPSARKIGLRALVPESHDRTKPPKIHHRGCGGGSA